MGGLLKERRVFTWAIVAAGAIALAGCGGAAEEEPTPETLEEPPATQTESPTSPAPEIEEDPVEAEPAEPELPADPAACLVGTWIADNEHFLVAIQEFGDEIESVTGEVTLEFGADGAIATTYNEWSIQGMTESGYVEIFRDGIDTGTYTATDGTITITETDIGSQMSVNTMGIDMPVEPLPVDYVDVEYTCAGDAAEILTPDGTLELTRR